MKMTRATVERARELSEIVARHGWESVAIDRSDPATLTAIVEAAIDVLWARTQKKK